MKLETHETFELNITLTREEAENLKAFLQNGPDNEPLSLALWREEFFKLLVAKGI